MASGLGPGDLGATAEPGYPGVAVLLRAIEALQHAITRSSACSSSTGEDSFDACAGWSGPRRRVVDHLAVGVDRDALGDEVLLDHVDQGRRLRRIRSASWVGGRRAEKLGSPPSWTMRAAIWSACACSSFACSRNSAATALRLEPLRHEVVSPVAEHADDLGRERLVQQAQHVSRSACSRRSPRLFRCAGARACAAPSRRSGRCCGCRRWSSCRASGRDAKHRGWRG